MKSQPSTIFNKETSGMKKRLPENLNPDAHIKEDVIILAERAHRLREVAVGHLYGMQLNRLGIGLTLIEIKAENGWEHLGFESFNAFCAAPMPSGGLGLNASYRQALMQVYRVYVMELEVSIDKLQVITWSNLRTIISIVNKNNVDKLLPEASSLVNADLIERKVSGELVGEPVPLDAEKEKDRSWTFLRCPNCDHEWKI
jgi:hypothetical protein